MLHLQDSDENQNDIDNHNADSGTEQNQNGDAHMNEDEDEYLRELEREITESDEVGPKLPDRFANILTQKLKPSTSCDEKVKEKMNKYK